MTLVLKYYADLKDAALSDLLRQVNIRTENLLIVYLILVDKIIQTLAEVQDHIISFIKVGQLTMKPVFQYPFLNQVQKVSTMHHVLQGWL